MLEIHPFFNFNVLITINICGLRIYIPARSAVAAGPVHHVWLW